MIEGLAVEMIIELTKAKIEPDLLRSVLRTAQYSLVEEQEVLARKEAERRTRKVQRQQEVAEDQEETK